MDPTVRRILCPIDFSARAVEVVDWAIEMAGRHDGSVVLLHAYRPPFELQQIEGAFIPELFWRELREDVERELHAYAERVSRAGVPVSEVTREGPPARVTVSEAERLRADMIVMGAASRNTLRGWLGDRVTDHVLSHAPCPVLTVKSH